MLVQQSLYERLLAVAIVGAQRAVFAVQEPSATT